MPTSFLPARPRPKIASAPRAIDWLAVWSLSLGLCALALAASVYFAAGDAVGAAMIMAGTAGVVATMLYASRESSREP